ncbi:glycosyltransferase family 39 protein [Actinomadura sp. 7K507]|uniref:glycosyltransferase family 39 protein n=1 Tax=Actinomadura sp. 7K507 TaxID=2530365 RepID=UPI001050F37C|nr:glycosyltransferase family 39 protein [Actinomadura sp. 7K507]TDC81673.1 hypothetical protein E1285_32180 [Actinomadura sp. 7K507]
MADRSEDDAPGPLRWLGLRAMPLVPAVVALAIALAGIRGPSFWLDEAATVSATGRPVPEMLRLFENLDLVHALYYLIMRPWVMLFGTGELALRLPSALATAAAAGGVAVIGRRCLGPAAGLLAGLMYGGTVSVTRFAQEARSYAMVTAVAVLATYLLIRGMREGGRHPWRWFAGYGLVIVVLGLLNLNAVFLVPAHAATLLAARPKAAGTWLRWLVASGLAAVALLPFALAARGQDFQVDWLPEPSWNMVWTLVRFMAGGVGLVAPVLLLALIGAFAGFGRREGRSLTAVALPWLVVPPTLMLVVSLLGEPLFMYRYVVFCLPALALLTGAGLARIAALGRPAVGGLVLAAVVAALVVASVPRHEAVRRQDSRPDDLRTPAEIVRANAQDGDVLVYLAEVVRWGASAYPDAYHRPRDAAMRRSPVQAANLKGRSTFPRELRRPLRSASRVWVMNSRSVGTPLAPLVQRRVEIVREMGPWRVAGTWKYRGGKLTLYERTAPYRGSR